MENKDLYYVAVKIFLLDDQERLLIIKDRFGDWDIPGGRLREDDFNSALPEVIKRKVEEELGGVVRYTLGQPITFMRHERNEILSNGDREKRRIFAIGYEAFYQGGEISLGRNHDKLEWVSLINFKPEDYFSGGWLNGIKEFQGLKK